MPLSSNALIMFFCVFLGGVKKDLCWIPPMLVSIPTSPPSIPCHKVALHLHTHSCRNFQPHRNGLKKSESSVCHTAGHVAVTAQLNITAGRCARRESSQSNTTTLYQTETKTATKSTEWCSMVAIESTLCELDSGQSCMTDWR